MPRLGLATIDISALGGSGGAVTSIDDFFFESFSAGEMHPILTTSRTNLLTYSEDFSQGIYSRVRSTLTPNDIVSPDGSANGSKLEADVTGNSGSWTNALVTSYSGGHTISVFAKKGTTEFLLITEVYPNGAVFNLDNGTVKQVSSGSTASISDEGNGWFRCSYSFNAASATKAFFIVGNSSTSITLHSATDGNNLYLFGAQLEQDSFVSSYIPTSGSTVTVSTTLNDTSEVWDFDGTDIMIAEDPEDEGFWEEGSSNLVLNHDYADLGSELVTDGAFDLGSELVSYPSDVSSITDPWVLDSSTNKYTYVDSGSGTGRVNFGTPFAVEVGQIYKVEVDVTISSGNASMAFRSGNSQTKLFDFTDFSNGLNTFFTTVSGVNGNISRIFVSSGNTDNDFTLNSVSVKRVNWDFESSWSFSGGKAVYDATTSQHYLKQTLSSISAGETVKIQFDISDVQAGKTAFLKLEIDGSPETVFTYTNFSAGTYTYYHKITSGLDRLNFVPATSGTGGAFSIDNISVIEIDPNNRWGLSNTTIEDGALTFTDNSSAAQYAFQDNVVAEGNVYEITLTVNRTSGTLQVLFGTGGSSVTGIGDITSSGTYTFITTPLTSGQSGNGRFWPGYTSASNNFIGTVDNVTVREYAIQPKDI